MDYILLPDIGPSNLNSAEATPSLLTVSKLQAAPPNIRKIFPSIQIKHSPVQFALLLLVLSNKDIRK